MFIKFSLQHKLPEIVSRNTGKDVILCALPVQHNFQEMNVVYCNLKRKLRILLINLLYLKVDLTMTRIIRPKTDQNGIVEPRKKITCQ